MSKIKEITIECENVEIDATSHANKHMTRIKAINVEEGFIRDIEADVIVQHQDGKDLLDAINSAYDEGFIMQWLMSKRIITL